MLSILFKILKVWIKSPRKRRYFKDVQKTKNSCAHQPRPWTERDGKLHEPKTKLRKKQNIPAYADSDPVVLNTLPSKWTAMK
jgi:hypothetical protein